MLFEGRYVPTNVALPYYAVTPDGQRFLMVKDSGPAQAPTQINVVLNWFEELKQKVPTIVITSMARRSVRSPHT